MHLRDSHIQAFRNLSRQYADTSLQMHEAIARKAGLTSTDHKYLGLLMQKGEMTAGELAQLTGLSTGAITGLLDRFEKKKLVQRRADPRDRRKVWIVPQTQNAIKKLEPIFEELQEKTEQLLSSFSLDEIQTIEKYFASSIKLMSSLTQGLKPNIKK